MKEEALSALLHQITGLVRQAGEIVLDALVILRHKIGMAAFFRDRFCLRRFQHNFPRLPDQAGDLMQETGKSLFFHLDS